MDHLNDWFLAARQSGSLSCDVLRLLLFTTSSACKALCELGLEGGGAGDESAGSNQGSTGLNVDRLQTLAIASSQEQ